MNFDFSLFGLSLSGFRQYPGAVSSINIEDTARRVLGRELKILRNDRLMTYIYWERVSDTSVVGFTLRFNNCQISRPKELMDLFESFVDILIAQGKVLKIDPSGCIKFRPPSFDVQGKSISMLLRTLLERRFELEPSKFGIEQMQGFPQEKEMKVVSYNHSNTDIVNLTYTTTEVDVIDESDTRKGYLNRTISDLRERLKLSESSVDELKRKNNALNRQKKQFWVVLFMMLVLVVGGVVLYMNNEKLNDTQTDLAIVVEEKEQLENDNNRLIAELNNRNTVISDVAPIIYDLNERSRSDWQSSNHNHYSSDVRTYVFFACGGDKVKFDYYVDSEGVDYLSYKFLGRGFERSDLFSGPNCSGTVSIPIERTGVYSLEVRYDKDGSVNSYSDYGSISNFRVEGRGNSEMLEKINEAITASTDSTNDDVDDDIAADTVIVVSAVEPR